MGIISSKHNIIEDDFDGESGDYNVAPEDVSHELTPDWLIDESDLQTLKEQCIKLEEKPDKVPLFSFNGNVIVGQCVKVYDGDTVHFVVNYNGQWVKRRFRMMGYNSPEIRGKTEDEKRRAIAARDYLASRLLNKKAVLYLHDFDKYGRVLCDVYLIEDESKLSMCNIFKHHINAEMIEKGHGVRYLP